MRPTVPLMTLFAWPKSFVDDPHIATIQRNAVRSWGLLRPRPEIILFGSEPGVKELCDEFGLIHQADVARNEFGTALVDAVFTKATELASSDILCYANADILLFQDFIQALSITRKAKRRFLMGVRPWDYDFPNEPGQCQSEFQRAAKGHGRLRGTMACDVFAFSRGLWPALPELALGRCGFDGALLRLARLTGAALVDATDAVIAVHQSHGYADPLKGDGYLWNPESIRNYNAVGGYDALFGWDNATHVVTGGKCTRAWRNVVRCQPAAMPIVLWWRKVAWFRFLKATRPTRRIVRGYWSGKQK